MMWPAARAFVMKTLSNKNTDTEKSGILYFGLEAFISFQEAFNSVDESSCSRFFVDVVHSYIGGMP